MKETKKHLIVFISLFIILNLLNTYFVTTELLNKYITVFPRSFFGELNAFFGNLAALTILIMLGFLFIKRVKPRLLYLIILTSLLNIGIFASGIFTKYYQTVFSLKETTLFKNPAVDLAASIFIEALKELYSNYRIVVFVPFIVLFIYYFIIKRSFKKNNLNFKGDDFIFRNKIMNTTVLAGAFTISLLSLSLFNISMKSKWPIFAGRPLYGSQSAGMYNYYLGQAFGFNFDDTRIFEIDVRTYQEYNKNDISYINLFNEEYSNILYKNDADIDFDLNPFMNRQELNGIFKDKNIVLIHLESFNHFLLNEDGPYLNSDYLKTFKKILSESYVMENFYTNVGLGNSSDAEFAVLTGAYPLGNSTMYWNYDKTPYVFNDLASLFADRYSSAFHGDVGLFYNRMKIYEHMYGFNNYYYFNPKESYHEDTQNGYWVFPEYVNTNLPNEVWLTENDILEWLKTTYNKTSENLGEKGFYYPILMNPHTPYLYNPTKEEDLPFNKHNIDVSPELIRYLNFEPYLESFFNKFLELTYTMKDTVYIFYGDHGSGISRNDYEKLLGIETTPENNAINNFKYQQDMLRTIAFIYAPDDDTESLDIKPGLIKGVQPRVRSQIDIYRTIIELFNLQTNNYYFGANLLSKEHTYAIDTKNFNIITDDYFIMGKKMINLENYEASYLKLTNDPLLDVIDIYEYVLKFKYKMDHAIKENAYQYLKK